MQSALMSIGVLLAYLVVVGVVWRVTGTRYDALVDSREHAIKGIVLPIGLGSLLLIVATTWLGWWRPALFQEPRLGPLWTLVVPVLFGLAAVINIATIDFRSPRARVLPWLLIGVVFVGFAEELATRGLPVVGLREAGASEWAVWLVTSVLFSLVHAMNALFGQSVRTTAVQLGMSFLAGSALYVTRMSTGTLIVAMLLHALWDFGSLGILATHETPSQKPVAGVLGLMSFALALVAVAVIVTA